MNEYRCAACGQVHDGLAFAFATEAPLAWDQLRPEERGQGSRLDAETCVIRDEHFFIRGLIEIPVLDNDGLFAWNVWSTLSRDNFQRSVDLWDAPSRSSEPPYFGWLATDLAVVYPPTLNLALHVHTRQLGQRPYLEVEPSDHPLSIEQRRGITLDRVREINSLLRHGG